MSNPKPSALLDLADNAAQWARLHVAIELGKGFALFFVVVANLETEALVVECLRDFAADVGRNLILLDARGIEDEAPIRHLLTDLGDRPLAVLCTHGALSRDREAFERCFVQLNGRRDQIVARLADPLIVITRVDALRTLGNIAPDLFSVHASQFHLSSTHDAGNSPSWLLLPHEAFGLLGVGETFARPPVDGMPSYREAIPKVPIPLIGRAEEISRLRVVMARSPRRIRVWGARGVGKSTVIAAAIRDFESYYERVVWFHGWAALTRNAILDAIVRALDEFGRCPVDPVDIEARYRELTRAQRVLIVVELSRDQGLDFDELPAPASGSLLIEEAATISPNADAMVKIDPLSDEHAHALWVRWTGVPESANTVEFSGGRPAIIELVARLWENDPGFRHSKWINRLHEPWLRCDGFLRELASELPRATLLVLDQIKMWSCFMSAIPRRFLVGYDEELFELEALGVLALDDDDVRIVGRPDGSFDFFDWGDLLEALEGAEPPLTPAEFEFASRALRLYTREWASNVEGSELMSSEHWIEDWQAAPQMLAQRALESLPVDERAAFATELAETRDADETLEWIRQAIKAAGTSGQLERARRLLSSANDNSSRESVTPIWLAAAQLVLALMPPTQFDDAGVAKLLFEWEPQFGNAYPDAAALARIRHGLSDGDDLEPLAIRAFEDALTQHSGPDLDTHAAEMARFDALAKQSAYPEYYDHFVHAHLCVRDLRRAHWGEAKQHLDRVIETAQTWGLAYPLLRARLLSLEFALATGDLEPATVELDATLARCDQLLGPLHPGSLAAITLALRIRDRLGQLDSARVLAEGCRRRIRYTHPHAAILSHLIEFFNEHGPTEVAASLRARTA